MPAESVHSPSQNTSAETSRFVVPNSSEGYSAKSAADLTIPEGVKGNIRETIDFDMDTETPNTYNTPGANPKDRYNFLYRPEVKVEGVSESGAEVVETVETHAKALEAVVSDVDAMKIQLELLNKEREARENYEKHGGLAEDQPRRVREQDGVTEKLVKYNDGSFEWQVVGVSKDAKFDKDIELAQVDDVPGTELEVFEAEFVEDDEPTRQEVAPLDDINEETIELKEVPAIEVAPKRLELEMLKKAEFTNSDEVLEQVRASVDRYAELTAKKRNGYVGHFLEKSKWLVKIPGVQKLGDWMNDRADAPVRVAKAEYESAVRGALAELKQFQEAQEIEDSEERRAEVRAEKLKILFDADTYLEASIVERQLEDSGRGRITKKFVDWWVQQENLGWKGKMKKFAAVGGMGLAAGAVAGFAGLGAIAGVAAGAAVGTGVMANVTKRRAGGETTSGETLAEARSERDMKAKAEAISEIDTNELDVSDYTGIVEETTRDEQIRNRARLGKGAKIGALGGGLGATAAGAIRDAIINGAPEVSASGPETRGMPEAPIKPEVVEVPKPEFEGLTFDVQDGSGYTQELMDFAGANGHSLTPDQSWELHQELMRQFGTDYININGGGSDIYLDGGDVRLAQPGSGEWANGVPEFVKSWMTSKGLW